MPRISRKETLAIFASASKENKKLYWKMLHLGINDCVDFLQIHGLFINTKAIRDIEKLDDFKIALDLHDSLLKIAESVQRLEKFLKKNRCEQ